MRENVAACRVFLGKNTQECAGDVEGLLRMEAKAAMPLREAALRIPVGPIAAVLVAPSVITVGWGPMALTPIAWGKRARRRATVVGSRAGRTGRSYVPWGGGLRALARRPIW